jgi:tetratricopeptide (TPR) repeat protein
VTELVLDIGERRPRIATPSDLLRPDAAVVSYAGRQGILSGLLGWCGAPEAVSVRLLTGAGGLGKTRLARELASVMAGVGWSAGFLTPDRPGAVAGLAALTGTGTPVLAVVDYAETRGSQVGRLLSTVWGATAVAPVRLLLLARSAGDWWAELRREYPDLLATAAVTKLGPLNSRSQDRGGAWRAALAAFAARIPDLEPGIDWESLSADIADPPGLFLSEYGSPLTLQMAALTALLQAGPHPVAEPPDASPEDVLLDHERVYWQRTAPVLLPRLDEDGELELELAVAAAALLGATSEPEAVATLERMPQFQEISPDGRLALARWIAGLYTAAPGQYWGTLQPDSLRELLLSRVMTDRRGLVSSLIAGASRSQANQALPLLRELSADQPEARVAAEQAEQAALDAAEPGLRRLMAVAPAWMDRPARTSGLHLAMTDVQSPWRWRWVLRDERSGMPLASHQVNLDPASDELARFVDLYEYGHRRAAPDRPAEDGARIVSAVSVWAGRELLGESVGAAIAAAAPATVRVTALASAERVLTWPLELAQVAGHPLAARGDVTLVYDIDPNAPVRRKDEPGETLRMLAVFSQPAGTESLALRRERYALERLIGRIAARQRLAVELQVVQYGVTRERLIHNIEDGEGWDVLHLAGHGVGELLLLENTDGSPDPVPTAELVALLRPLRRRVRLAVVSACETAADTTAETLSLLGLTEQAQAAATSARGPATSALPHLSQTLGRELDCGVVAMRYPVTAEFAIAFADELYEELLAHGQRVEVAVTRAAAHAAGPAPSPARPPASLTAPGVFGARAIGLTVTAPRAQPVLNPDKYQMAYFPAEPVRFVGQTETMARASAALAPGSGMAGVLLYGMAGAGKTACALELAYRQQDAFATLAFWQAPTRDEEWASALPGFAISLDIQLRDYGFSLANHIGTPQALDAFLPRLRRLLAEAGVLLVLDNLETLLTPDGDWQDPRWQALVGTLTSHEGESRMIVTSRIAPAGLAAQMVALPVLPLSPAEAAALAGELPNLRALMHADDTPEGAGDAVEADREQVLRVLRVSRGHPKLMELADAAAGDPERLDAQLAAAEAAEEDARNAASGPEVAPNLDQTLSDGTSSLGPERVLGALTEWTAGALGTLSADARLMAEFVACLEVDDQTGYVIEQTWAGLWRRLDRGDELPAPGPLLDELIGAALLEAEASPMPAADQSGPPSYRMHSEIAATIIAAAGPSLREAADAILADFWSAIATQARQREEGEDSSLVVRAGLAAVPYLLRRGVWHAASSLLQYAVRRDESPGTLQAALPPLRRIAAATGAPEDIGLLASVLRAVDPDEAERLLRTALETAAADGDYRTASAIAMNLVNLLRDAGRLRQALTVSEQGAQYTVQAGLGPWTRLLDQAERLQLLGLMGEHDQVLAEVTRLRATMAGLPDRPGTEEAVPPWTVREAILDAGGTSAQALGRWQQCLDLNAEITDSERRRGAGLHEITRTQVNAAEPLIQLGRLDEAGRLLAECQQVFEDLADIAQLARVLGTRAALENQLAHWEAAADLGRAALRLLYAQPEPRAIAAGHHSLANYLGQLGGDQAAQRAHRLAAALIFTLAGMSYYLDITQRVLAVELRDESGARLPDTVAEVAEVAGQTEGVRLGDLLLVLQPDPEVVDTALAEILLAAASLKSAELDIQHYRRQWEPVIAGVAAVRQTGQDAPAELLKLIGGLSGDPDWAALSAVLRRILAGEQDSALLLVGLDPIDTAIATEVLARTQGMPDERHT